MIYIDTYCTRIDLKLSHRNIGETVMLAKFICPDSFPRCEKYIEKNGNFRYPEPLEDLGIHKHFLQKHWEF